MNGALRSCWCFPWSVLALMAFGVATARAEVSFERDVMAVLSKAGCNSGPCHGNLKGKGDFRLSLRGQDPMADYFAITQDFSSRRVNRVRPEDSLFLQKPAGQVPHQGGMRFDIGSPEYRILRTWLANGMQPPASYDEEVELTVTPSGLHVRSPNEPVQLSVIARFSNGDERDVTRLASYETSNFLASVDKSGFVTPQGVGEVCVTVRYLKTQVPVRLAFVDASAQSGSLSQPVNYVDRHIDHKLQMLHLTATPLCNDVQFLRRTYLDLTGLIPTVEEAKTFLEDDSPAKRIRLIDALLARPEFADTWAQRWCDILRVEENLLDTKGVAVFHEWIRDCFAKGTPLNEFTRQIVAAEGSTYDNPPANFYRALREPLARGEAMARVFLGVRLQCAKCHNHPFDVWTQDDYYSWAACFAQVDYKIIENKRRDRFDKSQFIGEQIVQRNPKLHVINARTGNNAQPRLLGASLLTESTNSDSDNCAEVANWLSNGNRQFARAQVNRIWFHLMGRGLVEPVDDFRSTNPPSHPALLEELTDDFIRSNYDVRTIIRRIMTSNAYQRCSADTEPTEIAVSNYAVVSPRRLTAEQMLDAQCRFLGITPEFNGFDRGIRAGQLPGVHKISPRRKSPSPDDRFLMLFGKPERLMTCECERMNDTTLSQVFLLISDEETQSRLTSEQCRIARLAKQRIPLDRIVTELYCAALSRPPSRAEQRRINELLSATNRLDSQRRMLEDLAWALMNSKEFVFRN